MAAQDPRPGAWKTYLELAAGLGETSRKKARKVVREMVGKGNATADQLKAITSEVLAAREANREAVGKLIKVEVDRALGKVGLATMAEVTELTARVHELEKQLREAQAAVSAAQLAATAPPAPAVERQPPASRTRARAAKATAATVAAIGSVRRKGASQRGASEEPTAPNLVGTVVRQATRKAAAAKATIAKATGTVAAKATAARPSRTTRKAEQDQ